MTGRVARSPCSARRAASGRRRSRPTSRVAAAVERPDRVVLVDLALQFGGRRDAPQPATRGRRSPTSSATTRRCARPELLRGYATRHDSGLHVLAAPAQPRRPPRSSRRPTSSGSWRRCSRPTTSSSSTPAPTLDERVLTVLEAADTVILPVYPEIAALKAMHALLEYLNETGSVGLEVDVRAQQPVRPRDPQARATSRAPSGSKVAFELPYDPFLYLKAVNEGIPIVIGAARSAAAERLVQLSSQCLRRWTASAARCRTEERRSGGLFRVRR